MSETTSPYGVYVTTDRSARIAADRADARRQFSREIDDANNPERAQIVRTGKAEAKADLLLKLHRIGDISAEQLDAGRRFARAWEATSGVRTRGQLDQSPPGDAETAVQNIVDQGRFLSACRAALTTDELAAVVNVAVRGIAMSRTFRTLRGRSPNVREFGAERALLRSGLEKVAQVRVDRCRKS